jgi:hypothetical protein
MKKYLTFTNILILALAGLIIFSIVTCNGKKKLKTDVENLEKVKNENAALLKELEFLSIETSTTEENAPVGEILKPGEPISGNSQQVIKTEKELTRILAVNASLLKQLEEAEKNNRDVLLKLQKDGSVIVETVPIEEALPIVKTENRDTGEYYIHHSILHSRGDLLYRFSKVDVFPRIIQTNVPEILIEDKTKHNFLGLNIEATTPDPFKLDETEIPISILYIKKNIGFNGGLTFDNRFKGVERYQVGVIFGARW